MKNLKLNLEQNGLDSLKHAAEHFLDNTDIGLKYSLLHLAQSIELFLKSRIAKEHNLLIFTKPENSDENSRTITLDEAIKRLAAADVFLSNDAKLAFEKMQRIRNKVQHYEVNLNKKDVENEIGRCVKYLMEFLLNELNILLEDHLPHQLFFSLRDAIFSYEELDRLYKEEMNKFCLERNISAKPELCPDCGHFSIIYPDPRYAKNEIVECFYCKGELEVYHCPICNITCFLKEHIYHDCTYSKLYFGIN